MNPPSPLSPLRNHSGVALVIVLAMLVLATGLVIAFFSTVTSEATSSTVEANDTQIKQLADSIVDIITGQIVEATKGFETDSGGNPDLNKPLVWASQPGAIRTFKENGQPDRVFKLYSARRLVANASEFLNELNPSHTNADVPTDWASRTALYTDLNAPVKDASGHDVYPILNPSSLGGNVTGFSVSGAPTTGTTNPVPMPAQWLYILKDGTITSPTLSASTGTLASWGNGTGAFVPSANNPIVARIAFWTDDETAKVNINTASEGTYWDTPRASTQQERGFANFQPAKGEFQAYPGHPATTSLSAVFPTMTRNQIYDIVPRIVGGGSNNGTTIPSGALNPDSDRLYASLDELVFRNGNRDAGPLAKADLERAKFFLTTNSRAPETNLFNLPKVAIWPIDQNTSDSFRTQHDHLIARCSTINDWPFYFQRTNPLSATADFPGAPIGTPGLTGVQRNRNLYYYLQQLTGKPVPGFGGGTFASKYGADRDQILTEIFDYIRCTNLDDSNLGEVNRFADRAEDPADTTTDLQKRGFGQITPIRIGTTKGFGRFPVITEAGIHFICTAMPDDPGTPTDESLGSNVPTNKTLGANGTLTHPQRRIEALFFLETFIPGQGWPPVHPALTFRVQGLDSFAVTTNGTTTPLGFPADEYDLSDAKPGDIWHGRNWGGTNSHRMLLAYSKLRQRGVMPADLSATNFQRYHYVSVPVTVDAGNGTMTFSGGNVTVDIYYGRNGGTWPDSSFPSSNSDKLVQTYTFNFPGGTFPIPQLVPTGTSGTPATDKENWWTFSKDGAMPGKRGRADFWRYDPGFPTAPRAGAPFRAEDVVRTLVPSQDWADARRIAATGNVPTAAFVPHPDYNNTSKNLAHSVTEGAGSGYFNGFASSSQNLVSGISWHSQKTPDIPIANGNSQTNGDWDTGVSITTDGAYINKADEGNSRGLTSGKIPYFDDSNVYEAGGSGYFSPNRQMPSPGMFGSLPTGVIAGQCFRTLLFRPQPGHFGATAPKDHLLMDLFWMPVVEPYAISEPFSTAGKINMNYQIVPFTYIERSTGLHALLQSERVAAIPASAASTSDSADYKRGPVSSQFRLPINIQETLTQFQQKFAAGEIFKSATEICDLHIVPQGQTVSSMNGTFWNTHRLTGENLRERIYTTLYPRLTTKSNTYTVHYRVQALKKIASTPQNQWVEGRDQVLAEYRGSATIERYIDPNDPRLPDFATETDQAKANMDQYYRFRTISSRRFAP